ncbi:MAG: ATP-binding cassette domain-containing protein [Planctomycetota bacterium]
MKTDKPKSGDILLSMQGIVKDFGGTRALDHVAFDVRRGEVHALIGENGAGKSTLVNVLSGRFSDYAGTIVFDGRPVRITHPRQGRQMGIAVIFQDLNVLPNFTVAENIMLAENKPRVTEYGGTTGHRTSGFRFGPGRIGRQSQPGPPVHGRDCRCGTA